VVPCGATGMPFMSAALLSQWKPPKKSFDGTRKGNKLTCKGEPGLSADDGPESVGGEALVRSSILVFVQMADSEVASGQAVVSSRSGTDLCAIQFPPVNKWMQEKINMEIKKVQHCSAMDTFQNRNQKVSLLIEAAVNHAWCQGLDSPRTDNVGVHPSCRGLSQSAWQCRLIIIARQLKQMPETLPAAVVHWGPVCRDNRCRWPWSTKAVIHLNRRQILQFRDTCREENASGREPKIPAKDKR